MPTLAEQRGQAEAAAQTALTPNGETEIMTVEQDEVEQRLQYADRQIEQLNREFSALHPSQEAEKRILRNQIKALHEQRHQLLYARKLVVGGMTSREAIREIGAELSEIRREKAEAIQEVAIKARGERITEEEIEQLPPGKEYYEYRGETYKKLPLDTVGKIKTYQIQEQQVPPNMLDSTIESSMMGEEPSFSRVPTTPKERLFAAMGIPIEDPLSKFKERKVDVPTTVELAPSFETRIKGGYQPYKDTPLPTKLGEIGKEYISGKAIVEAGGVWFKGPGFPFSEAVSKFFQPVTTRFPGKQFGDVPIPGIPWRGTEIPGEYTPFEWQTKTGFERRKYEAMLNPELMKTPGEKVTEISREVEKDFYPDLTKEAYEKLSKAEQEKIQKEFEEKVAEKYEPWAETKAEFLAESEELRKPVIPKEELIGTAGFIAAASFPATAHFAVAETIGRGYPRLGRAVYDKELETSERVKEFGLGAVEIGFGAAIAGSATRTLYKQATKLQLEALQKEKLGVLGEELALTKKGAFYKLEGVKRIDTGAFQRVSVDMPMIKTTKGYYSLGGTRIKTTTRYFDYLSGKTVQTTEKLSLFGKGFPVKDTARIKMKDWLVSKSPKDVKAGYVKGGIIRGEKYRKFEGIGLSEKVRVGGKDYYSILSGKIKKKAFISPAVYEYTPKGFVRIGKKRLVSDISTFGFIERYKPPKKDVSRVVVGSGRRSSEQFMKELYQSGEISAITAPVTTTASDLGISTIKTSFKPSLVSREAIAPPIIKQRPKVDTRYTLEGVGISPRIKDLFGEAAITKTRVKLRTETRDIEKLRYKPALIPESKTRVRIKAETKFRVAVLPRVTQKTKLGTRQVTGVIFPTPPITTTTPIVPPTTPGFNFGAWIKLPKWKETKPTTRVGTFPRYKYQPSLAAIVLGIYGEKPKRRIFTGLERRPMLRKPKKRKKIKSAFQRALEI